DGREFTFSTNTRYDYLAEMNGDDLVQKIDGTTFETYTDAVLPGVNSRDFYFGTNNGATSNFFQGKLYSFSIGPETFDLTEGSGTVLTGSNGVKVDIYGATWNEVSAPVAPDTTIICDTVQLPPEKHLTDATFLSDTLYLTLNDGSIHKVEIISGASQVLT